MANAGQGGGIFNEGELTITNSTISGNSTNYELGGGGIFNAIGGTLTLLNSTVSRNSAACNYFPNPDFPGCSGGGGIYNSGTLLVINSTIVGNSTYDCVAGGGGILNAGGAITIVDSSISGNSVSNEPDDGLGDGPVFGSGGGVNGGMILANSIVAGNTVPAPIPMDNYVPRGRYQRRLYEPRGNIANMSSSRSCTIGQLRRPDTDADSIGREPPRSALGS
jgi:hypothetical protein